MSWALIGVQLFLLAEAMRRSGAVSAFSLIGAYILFCQLAFIAAPLGGIIDPHQAGQLYAYLSHNEMGVALYAALFLLAYMATLGLRMRGPERVDMRLAAQRLPGVMLPLLLACWVLALLHAVSLDPDLLWHNRQYLLLAAPEGLALRNRLTELVASGVPLIGLAVTFGLFFALFTGRRGLALAFLLPAAWFWLFALASASRVAATYGFVPVVLALVLLERRRAVVAFGCVLLALFMLLMALNGRGTHGFGVSMLGDYAALALSKGMGQLSLLVGNLAQGIFVTTDGLLRGAQHGEAYKLLSFSPFPSLVDGFDQLRRVEEIRLHPTVPMSAISEVIAFGPPYWVAAGLVFVTAIRLCLVAAQRGLALLSVLASVWVFLLFVQAGAYPLRNVFRQELMIIVLLTGGLMLARPKRIWA